MQRMSKMAEFKITFLLVTTARAEHFDMWNA